MAVQEIKVPDLEGAEDVGVVEVYVAVGDIIEVETPLISLESDKAVMDVPSPFAGTVTEIKVSEGDTVNAGDLIILAEIADTGDTSRDLSADATEAKASADTAPDTEDRAANPDETVIEIKVPDLEGSTDVAVVEVYVSPGEKIEPETPLISLESDKAVMDVPSPVSGEVLELKIGEGDTVNSTDVIALVKTGGAGIPAAAALSDKNADAISSGTAAVPSAVSTVPSAPAARLNVDEAPVNTQPMGGAYHATPSVRSLSRELGVDLSGVKATGPKGRITREDVTSLVKQVMAGGASAPSSTGGFSLPPIPSADYAEFGEIETESLGRIQKISGPHLHRNWVGVPHVTQFEDADITELEAFRKKLNEENARSGEAKISPLIFIIKAAARALEKFPNFNSSLNPDGASLTRKKYIHIGIAVDTPGGLMVPVIQNADTKGIREIAAELNDLSLRAREGKLKAAELKGATFSISSLGGIGGTYFTPIVNAPEVAILGLSRSAMKPVWNGEDFVPRLILPFSVSYDHRVIDGAQGARFAAYLSSLIGDMRRVLL